MSDPVTAGTFTFTYHDGRGNSGKSDPLPHNADGEKALAAYRQAAERAGLPTGLVFLGIEGRHEK
jgi:hypothetical protein